MGDDRTDDLLKEIASKHGVALDREDPILIVQTLHARLLADSQSAQQAMLEDYRTTLESLLDRWSAETTAKAERIVTASLTATTETMKTQMATTTTNVAHAIQKEVTVVMDETESRMRRATTVGYLNLLAALVTFLSAVVVYWTLRP
ncbi:MAG: conjugal transfer protein TraM [Nitrospira sp. CG24B]|jgi:prophage DNA circulation protein|nr:MAG: conjugal transfer protein TraM [Nitrospira sp. CG24B]